MYHVIEYALFEGNGGKKKMYKKIYSTEFLGKFPALAISLKKEMSYYSIRGWDGYLDIEELPLGKTDNKEYFLSVVPNNKDIPPIILNMFYIPKGARTLEDLKPVASGLSQADLSDMDIKSISAVLRRSKHGKAVDVTKDILEIPNKIEFKLRERSVTWTDILRAKNGTIYGKSEGGWKYSDSYSERYVDFMFHLILPLFKYMSSEVVENVSREDVKNLPEYKDLMKWGFIDATSSIILKNDNMRLLGTLRSGFSPLPRSLSGKKSDVDISEMGRTLELSIYSSGLIRNTGNNPPAILPGGPNQIIKNKSDWSDKLKWILYYYKRYILTTVFNLKGNNEAKRISELPDEEYIEELIRYNPALFMEWVLLIPNSTMTEYILGFSESAMKKFINDEPGKAAMSLKKIYKMPAVKKIVDDISKGDSGVFKDILNLSGDLGEIGF